MGHPGEWLACLAVTLALAAAGGFAVTAGAPPSAPPALALTVGSLCSLLGALLAPRHLQRSTPGLARPGLARLSWSALVGVTGATAAALLAALPAHPALFLAAGITLFTLTLTAAGDALSRRFGAPGAAALVTALFVTACAAPLFLGPVAELFPERRWLLNALVWMSPLSHLAPLLDFDYLRTPWFYEHARLGGYRFGYPPLTVSATGVAALAAWCHRAARLPVHSERIDQS